MAEKTLCALIVFVLLRNAVRAGFLETGCPQILLESSLTTASSSYWKDFLLFGCPQILQESSLTTTSASYLLGQVGGGSSSQPVFWALCI